MRVILVIGVSGSGKSTIAQHLAKAIGADFLDADDFHPAANIAKMSQGIPLEDTDRLPWLRELVATVQGRGQEGRSVVLACSALKESYRQPFREAFPQLELVTLKGSFEQIEERMRKRQGHFMKSDLLRSQFATFEPPTDGLHVDIDRPLDHIMEDLLAILGGRP